MSIHNMTVDEIIEEFLKDTREAINNSCIYENKQLGVTQAIVYGTNRDASMLHQTNFDIVSGDLIKYKGVHTERFNHWACGWVDYLIVVCRTKAGKPTKAMLAAIEWQKKLEDYPVADEEEYSRREYETMMENMPEALKDLIWHTDYEMADKLPDDWYVDVARNVDQYENADDDGWPRFYGKGKENAISYMLEKGYIVKKEV